MDVHWIYCVIFSPPIEPFQKGVRAAKTIIFFHVALALALLKHQSRPKGELQHLDPTDFFLLFISHLFRIDNLQQIDLWWTFLAQQERFVFFPTSNTHTYFDDYRMLQYLIIFEPTQQHHLKASVPIYLSNKLLMFSELRI